MSESQSGTPTTKIDECEMGWKACEVARQDLKTLLKAEREYSAILEKQRKEALEAQQAPASTPWYVWLIVGAAGGVVLTRGLR